MLLSKEKTIIASWNGNCTNTKLTYGEVNHPEYVEYNVRDVGSKIYVLGDNNL
jgi:hypothetical protein